MLECITGGYVLEKLLMQLRAALFAIIKGMYAPVLPHTQRVMPCSSSSSTSAATSSGWGVDVSGTLSRTGRCLSLSFVFLLDLPLEEPLAEEAEWGIGILRSSWGSSCSSCFGRLFFEFEFVDMRAGRRGKSFCLGMGSESGERDAKGAERLPERLGSRGERGGPIVAA